MIDFSLELEIEGVETIEPDIPGNFIFTLSPDAFLFIESRLVRRKVLKVNPCMALEEELDCFAFVPVSPIHIEMDRIASECSEYVLQDLQESLPVALGRAYQSFPAQQWRHPAGQIEPLPVLTGRGNSKAFTLLCPTSPEAGMEAKASFVLKGDGFIGFQLGQFFLTPCENRLRPWPGPEDKHSQPASGCSPSDAASIGPVVSSGQFQNPSSGELPASAHPMQPSADRTPGEAFPGRVVAAPSTQVSVDSDGLAGAWASGPESRSDLLHVSIVPESYDLDPTKRLPVPDAGPPKPATGRRSSTLPMPPEPASQGPVVFLWWPRGASELRLS